MTRRQSLAIVLTATTACLGLWSGIAQAQQQTQQKSQPPTAPAVEKATLVYEVVALQGKVRWAKSGILPTAREGWAPVKLGQKIKAGEQVSVPWRGKVKFVATPADPPTVMLFESGSLINISELALVDGTAKSRLDLAYGAIRAGVAEGKTRSDMQIKSPGATLSKRGTDIFRFEYANGRYNMSLTPGGRGMIQAIQHQSTAYGSRHGMRTRNVTAGQFVTHAMLRAIDHASFDRQVNVSDFFGIQGVDELFTMANGKGIGFLLPQGGGVGGSLGPTSPGGSIGGPQGIQQDDGPSIADLMPTPRPSLIHRDGDFGVGQGLVPGIFGAPQKSIRQSLLERMEQRNTQARDKLRILRDRRCKR